MIIGTVKETKNHEYRVGLTPECVHTYRQHGHRVLVQREAGRVAGFTDNDYASAGAEVLPDREAVYESADMIIKVKEPQADEIPLLRANQILFAYLHLAADRALTEGLLDRGVRAVALETMQDADGGLPCLRPMSMIAGRMAIQEGARFLESPFGGKGVLLAGVPGVACARVVVLGGGVVGESAARIALGMGARVTVLDVSSRRLWELERQYEARIETVFSSRIALEQLLAEADLVVGAVLVPGAVAPKVIRTGDLKLMQPGTVLVDVAVDQGGCSETTVPTTHDAPVYTRDGVVHYCVANMPGAVARTGTLALAHETRRFGTLIADQGLDGALGTSVEVRSGLNLDRGRCVHPAVAEAHGFSHPKLADRAQEAPSVLVQ